MTKTKSWILAIVLAFVFGAVSALVLPEKYSTTLPIAIGLAVGWATREITMKGLKK